MLPESKLNCLGLSECGEAVVELANQSFESVGWVLWTADDVVVVDGMEFVEPLLLLLLWPLGPDWLLGPPPPPLPLLPRERVVGTPLALTWPRAIAMGLGEESGDEEVSDEI